MTPPGEREPPSLRELAWVFLIIGMQSFGGGLSAWIRREIVTKRGWVEERAFLGGLALCQIAPGPNAVNLAVFIGTTLRGRPGALAALSGMLVAPVILVLIMGAAFASLRDVPGLESAMTGVGAAAIGLTIATGIRLARRNIRTPVPIVLAAVTALSVGVLGLPLLGVLVVMIPVSLLLARRRNPAP